MISFQDLIFSLQKYWSDLGCCVLQPFDLEVGAGTFHPYSFLKSIGPEPASFCYVQPCRRPTDGRYGDNPNRLQHYYQFQVLIKPSPDEIKSMYLGSLEALGVDIKAHDIRFVEDNWESPTLGAWGLGWEVWLDGMEVTQFTYFQQVGGLNCSPVSGEITYGLERLCMYLQQKNSVYDLLWSNNKNKVITYGDIFKQNEYELSSYNFEYADVDSLLSMFNVFESQCRFLLEIENPLPLAAYELVVKASHVFNLLDARSAISITERQAYIIKIGSLANLVAKGYYASREKLGFPLCD